VTGPGATESLLRQTLRNPDRTIDLPVDYTNRVIGRVRRRRRRFLGSIVAVVVVLVAGALVAGQLRRDRETAAAPEVPAAAEDTRLLAWTPRGGLITDAAFVEQAAAVWRAAPEETEGGPGPEIYPLWAGVVGEGRLALLQSVSPSGRGLVAQVAQHRGELVLDRVDALPQEAPPALVLTYDGDLDLPSLLPGSGAELLTLLLADEGSTVDVLRRDRSVRSGEPGGNFVMVGVAAAGLSKTFLHLSDRESDGTVVAVVRRDGPAAGRVETFAARSRELIPLPAPVHLQIGDWGPGPAGAVGAYDDALVARRALGPAALVSAEVLWSDQVDDDHASLLRARGTSGGDSLVLALRFRSTGVCLGQVPDPGAAAEVVVVSCAAFDVSTGVPTGERVSVVVARSPDTRVALGFPGEDTMLVRGVGSAWVRTPVSSPEPVLGAA